MDNTAYSSGLELSQIVNDIMPTEGRQIEARQPHRMRRVGQAMVSMVAAAAVTLGVGDFDRGAPRLGGDVAEAYVVPDNYDVLPKLNIANVDESLTALRATTVRANTGSQLKPSQTPDVFYAFQTPDASYGPAVAAENVEGVEAELYQSLAEDAALFVATAEDAGYYGKMDQETRDNKVHELRQDQTKWDVDFEEFMKILNDADMSLDTFNGEYITGMMTDDVDGDGVPEIVKGVEKAMVGQKVLKIKFKDGRELIMKLGCGFQKVERAIAKKVATTTTKKATTTTQAPTTTTAAPTTTSTVAPTTSSTSTSSTSTSTSTSTTVTLPSTTTTTSTLPTTTTTTSTTTTTRPAPTTTSTSTTTTTRPAPTTTIPDKVPQPPVTGGPSTTVEAPVPGPSVPTTRLNTVTSVEVPRTSTTNTVITSPRPTSTLAPINAPTSVATSVPEGPSGINPENIASVTPDRRLPVLAVIAGSALLSAYIPEWVVRRRRPEYVRTTDNNRKVIK